MCQCVKNRKALRRHVLIRFGVKILTYFIIELSANVANQLFVFVGRQLIPGRKPRDVASDQLFDRASAVRLRQSVKVTRRGCLIW